MFKQKEIKCDKVSIQVMQVLPKSALSYINIGKIHKRHCYKYNFHKRHKTYLTQEMFGDRDAIARHIYNNYGAGQFVLMTSQWCNVIYTDNTRPHYGCKYGSLIRSGVRHYGWIRREKRMRKCVTIDIRGYVDNNGTTIARMNFIPSKHQTITRYKWLFGLR
jgi:hypothetical protein